MKRLIFALILTSVGLALYSQDDEYQKYLESQKKQYQQSINAYQKDMQQRSQEMQDFIDKQNAEFADLWPNNGSFSTILPKIRSR